MSTPQNFAPAEYNKSKCKAPELCPQGHYIFFYWETSWNFSFGEVAQPLGSGLNTSQQTDMSYVIHS